MPRQNEKTYRTPKQPVILQVLPSLGSGGVERGTVEVARAIEETGWKSLVASAGGKLVSFITHAGAEHLTLPLATKNPVAIWRNAAALERVIRRHNVDIVHARSRAPAWSAWLAAQRTGCRFLTTFHGIYGRETRFKQRYNGVMTRGELVIAVSEYVARHLHEEYGVPAEKIRIIHRGVDFRVFNPYHRVVPRMVELAAQWRVPETLPLILFPGRITRWKGQDACIKALGRLPHRNFFCLLLGDDEKHPHYRNMLEKLIAKLNLEGHVRMAGATPWMAEAYMMSRLVIATSVKPEAFGRVVLEAQAMGKPVIAGDEGGPRETVLPGATGWLVPPGDVDALAQAIDAALSMDEESLARMGEQAIGHAHHFTTAAMCEKTLEVYWELLTRGKA